MDHKSGAPPLRPRISFEILLREKRPARRRSRFFSLDQLHFQKLKSLPLGSRNSFF
jgi:hypothetical protein